MARALDEANDQRPDYFSGIVKGVLVAIGAALWLVAALLLRWIVPLGAFDGANAFLSYALVVPGTLPFLLAVKFGLRLRPEELPLATAIVTASALLIDGVVVRWLPGIYGSNSADVATAAGAVLWGAGVGLVLGFVLGRSPNVTAARPI